MLCSLPQTANAGDMSTSIIIKEGGHQRTRVRHRKTLLLLAKFELADNDFLQSCKAFASSSNTQPIGDDQVKLGGETVWPAAPLKVAIELVLEDDCEI
jgi:hypothetical protein